MVVSALPVTDNASQLLDRQRSCEVWGCDFDAAASEREETLLSGYRGTSGPEEEEAEEHDKKGEGQVAKAGEEEVKKGVSSHHRTALPYPGPVTGLATRLIRLQ